MSTMVFVSFGLLYIYNIYSDSLDGGSLVHVTHSFHDKCNNQTHWTWRTKKKLCWLSNLLWNGKKKNRKILLLIKCECNLVNCLRNACIHIHILNSLFYVLICLIAVLVFVGFLQQKYHTCTNTNTLDVQMHGHKSIDCCNRCSGTFTTNTTQPKCAHSLEIDFAFIFVFFSTPY